MRPPGLKQCMHAEILGGGGGSGGQAAALAWGMRSGRQCRCWLPAAGQHASAHLASARAHFSMSSSTSLGAATAGPSSMIFWCRRCTEQSRLYRDDTLPAAPWGQAKVGREGGAGASNRVVRVQVHHRCSEYCPIAAGGEHNGRKTQPSQRCSNESRRHLPTPQQQAGGQHGHRQVSQHTPVLACMTSKHLTPLPPPAASQPAASQLSPSQPAPCHQLSPAAPHRACRTAAAPPGAVTAAPASWRIWASRAPLPAPA